MSQRETAFSKRAHSAHISRILPHLHASLREVVGAINRPERDAQLLAQAGLSLERALFPLIVHIAHLGPIGVVELADRVGRDYTTVSRQIARLEQLGLIERRNSAVDRRTRAAVVTERGADLSRQVDAAREEMARTLFADWSTQDIDDLDRLIGKLADALNGVGDPPAAS